MTVPSCDDSFLRPFRPVIFPASTPQPDAQSKEALEKELNLLKKSMVAWKERESDFELHLKSLTEELEKVSQNKGELEKELHSLKWALPEEKEAREGKSIYELELESVRLEFAKVCQEKEELLQKLNLERKRKKLSLSQNK